ncbi:MAG: energy transducer TonB [Aeromonadaceae bacterium]|nr:energy transducer TonB [Aeromonadaceae bacterium]MBP9568625.1 energy transducer TonB [Aeromonadaceae bacterium]
MTKPSNASPQKMDLEPFSVAVEPGGPVITQARYRGTPIPEEYPLMARRRGWQGTVMVEVWLDANGEQIKREILQSSGYALLDQAALRSVARNQFTPYTINGVGHPARLHLPVIYTLTAQ